MASAAPMPRPIPLATIWKWTKLALGGLAAALAGGFIAAYATYLFTARLNNEAALQQQYLVAVQDFNATGARVDASITELSDTVLDGVQIRDARKEARQAIAAHAAATQSLVQVIGQGNANEYMAGLATLRTLVDETANPGTALRTSRARRALMANRTVVVAEARRRIYGQPQAGTREQ